MIVNMAYQSGSDNIRPVEYISSSGTQYIVIPYYINNSTIIEAEWKQDAGTTAARVMFGFRKAYTSNMFAVFISATTLGANISGNDMGTVTTTDMTVKRTIKLAKDGLYLDGTKIRSNTASGTVAAAFPYQTMVFSMYDRGSDSSPTDWECHGSLYSIKELGQNAFDCIPAYNSLLDEGGLWDKKNGVFYRNAGTGSFGLGPFV